MIDIFQWANNIDGMKQGIEVELFLFNKNYTPYSIRRSRELEPHLKPVFLFNTINWVAMGAGVGLRLVELEKADGSQNTLPHTSLDKVGRADTLLHLIEHERNDIVEFSQEEHEFKRIKGVVARFTHPTDKSVRFYVIKQLPTTSSISTDTAWQIINGELQPHAADVSLKMPTDNQMLVIDGEIFIFNQSKFAQLFNYDVQQVIRSDEIAAKMSEHYKLSLPDLFNDFAVMAREKKSTLKKLLEVNTETLPDQETVLEIADEMQVELMAGMDGEIVLMDHRDVGVFLDIVNDNYLSSSTGSHYLAKSKKLLEVDE